MAAALPFISAGLGIYSTIKGSQQQGKATRDYEQQLAQQEQVRKMVLGRLTQGPQGDPNNPFSAPYGAIQMPPSPEDALRGGVGSIMQRLLQKKAGR